MSEEQSNEREEVIEGEPDFQAHSVNVESERDLVEGDERDLVEGDKRDLVEGD